MFIHRAFRLALRNMGNLFFVSPQRSKRGSAATALHTSDGARIKQWS
ncbi:hypothetical protein NIES2100_48740 [Calothrix sp. NIES-2100]|nr:hypothetical protein NIES2100_48740 [Calothrix sp. NIES-2100]